MRRCPVFVLALVLLGSAAAASDPPLTTDRPDQSDSPYVVPRGLFQIEGGVSYGERNLAGEDLTLTAFPLALLRYGLTDAMELRLTVPGIAIQTVDTTTGDTDDSGLVDAALGLKFAIAEQRGAVPDVAFVGTLFFPSGDNRFTSDRADPGFRFAFSNVLTESVSLTYNVGMLWLTERTSGDVLDTRSYFDWTTTVGVAVKPKLAAFGELFGVTGISAEGGSITSTGGGVTYLLTPRMQLDGRITAGLSSAALDWTLNAGVSYRLPR